jgi:uncharacterized protein YodC (DUF2158 family)
MKTTTGPSPDAQAPALETGPLLPGDLIRHKTGGPKLAVISAPSGGSVTVEWMDERKGPQVGIVSLAAVQRVPTDPVANALSI